MLTVDLACLAVLLDYGVRPDMVAGHSLGEYGALVAADVLGMVDALKLVRTRGVITGEVAAAVGGGMAAVIGVRQDTIAELIGSAKTEGNLVVSNYNCPGQVVISGEAAALDKAIAVAPSLGGVRVRRLPVSGPFHSPMMEPAAREFATHMGEVKINNPAVPVMSNYDARPYGDGELIGDRLVKQLCNPVRWEESVARMSAMGADVFIEVGPGTVLGGLIGRCLPGTKVLHADDPDSISGTLTYFGKESPLDSREWCGK